jgi:hypothetical protein
MHKWIHQRRQQLYKAIVVAAGNYSSWDKKGSEPPPRGYQTRPFHRTLRVLRDEWEKEGVFLGKKGQDVPPKDRGLGAIKSQIAWATTAQTFIQQAHVMSWLSNKIAAYEAGFLNDSNLPKVISLEKEVDWDWDANEPILHIEKIKSDKGRVLRWMKKRFAEGLKSRPKYNLRLVY